MLLFQYNKTGPEQAKGKLAPQQTATPMQNINTAQEDEVPRFYQKEDIFGQVARQITAISQGSNFRGDIESEENLIVFGNLVGNLTTKAAVQICGTVKGEIRCDSLSSKGGVIEGNVFALGFAECSADSSITGDLHCARAILEGRIKGNVVVEQGVVLGETAVLDGDITASEIEVSRGARINGAVKMTASPEPPKPVKPPIAPIREPKEDKEAPPAPASEKKL